MRPSLLDPLFAAITTLSGVGPRIAKLYRKLLDREHDAARRRSPVSSADRHDRPPGATEAPRRALRHRRDRRGHGRAPPTAATQPAAGALPGLHQRRHRRPRPTFFNAREDYLRRLLPVGARVYVSGTISLYEQMLQMVHPDRVVAEAELGKLPLVEAVYRLTQGSSLNQVGKAADAALARLPELPEWRTRAGSHATVCRRSRRRCAPCIGRPSRPTCCPTDRRGRGSPMTSCWPASSHSRWCEHICAGPPGGRPPAPDSCGHG